MRVLLTGAAGNLGGLVIQHLAKRYDWILTDLHPPRNTQGLPFIPADITEIDTLRPLCKQVDTIVHLAGDPRPEAAWESLLSKNLIGVYNVFQAASEANCRRVIFASSSFVVDGYPQNIPVPSDAPPNPLTLYGASKAWGEAAAAFYANQKNLSCICLRLGWVIHRDNPGMVPGAPHLDVVLTPEDLIRLIIASLEAPNGLRFGIFNGISNNLLKRLDISSARKVLKYEPQDDAFELAQRNYPNIARHVARRVKRALRSRVSGK